MSKWRTSILPAISKRRELLVFAPLYFWLSFINYALKIWRTPSWFSVLEINHAALLKFEYTNNEQSRLLQFYVPEFFHRVFGTTIPHSYALSRLLFVFLTFLCFHFYLRKWFAVGEAFAGVALLAAVLPFTYMNDLQESSPLLTLLFLLALQAIRDNRIVFMLSMLFLGGLTNETMMILPAVYFFYHVRFDSLRSVLVSAGKAFLVGLPLIATLGAIRYYNRHRPHLGGGYHLPDNMQGMVHDFSLNLLDMPWAGYILFILFVGVLWYYALTGYARNPLFLRRASWLVPLFILAHLVTGKINEPRQMVPLSFILIPMSMFFLLGKAASDDDKERDRSHEAT